MLTDTIPSVKIMSFAAVFQSLLVFCNVKCTKAHIFVKKILYKPDILVILGRSLLALCRFLSEREESYCVKKTHLADNNKLLQRQFFYIKNKERKTGGVHLCCCDKSQISPCTNLCLVVFLSCFNILLSWEIIANMSLFSPVCA